MIQWITVIPPEVTNVKWNLQMCESNTWFIWVQCKQALAGQSRRKYSGLQSIMAQLSYATDYTKTDLTRWHRWLLLYAATVFPPLIVLGTELDWSLVLWCHCVKLTIFMRLKEFLQHQNVTPYGRNNDADHQGTTHGPKSFEVSSNQPASYFLRHSLDCVKFISHLVFIILSHGTVLSCEMRRLKDFSNLLEYFIAHGITTARQGILGPMVKDKNDIGRTHRWLCNESRW